MSLKIFLYLFLIIILTIDSYSQTYQKGIILEYRGKLPKKSLSLVAVSATGALSQKSNSQGKFTFYFNELKPGDLIKNLNVSKPGYVIFNKQETEQFQIASQDKELTILMCKKEEFDRLINLYYSIGENSYKEKYEEAELELETLLSQHHISKLEYEQRHQEIENQYQNEIQNLEQYALGFARIDENDLTEKQARILELVKQGKLEEAIALFDDKNDIKEYARAVKQKKLGQTFMDKGEHDRSILEKKILLEINILILSGGQKNLQKANEKLKTLAWADTTQFTLTFMYATFAHEQLNFIDAEKFYNITLNNTLYRQQATILNNLGNLHALEGKYDLAEKEFKKSIEISQAYALINPSENLPQLITTWMNLGNLYEVQGKNELAEKTYQNSLNICKQLNQQDSNRHIYDQGIILMNLGSLHSKMNLKHLAEKEFIQALHILESIPVNYRHQQSMALLYSNLGALYLEKEEIISAENILKKGMEIYQHLIQMNASANSPGMASLLINIGHLYQQSGEISRADSAFQASYRIRHQLFTQNPDVNRKDYISLLFETGIFNSNCQKYTLAEKQFNEALEICNTSEKEKIADYKTEKAKILKALGEIHEAKGDNKTAQEFYEKSLDLFVKQAEVNPYSCQDYIALLYAQLGKCYEAQFLFALARKNYNKSLALLNQISDSDTDLYKANIGDVLIRSGILYTFQENYFQAKEEFEKALAIFDQLIEKGANTYLLQKAMILNNLGELYQQFYHNKEAEENYNNSLHIFRNLAKKNQDTYLYYVAKISSNLGDFYARENNINQAFEKYEEALEIFRHYDPHSYNTGRILKKMAILHHSEYNTELAIKELNECLEIYSDLYQKSLLVNKNELFEIKEIYQHLIKEKQSNTRKQE